MTEQRDRQESLVADMLRRADTDSVVPADARQRARGAMLSAYEDMAQTLGAQQREAEVLTFEKQHTHRASASPRRRLPFLGAIAACLVVLVGLAIRLPSSNDVARPTDSADADRSEFETGTDGQLIEPVRLAAGFHRTEMLGPSVGFTLDGPLHVVREGEGFIELAVDPGDPAEARMWIFGPESLKLVGDAPSVGEFFDGHSQISAQFVPSVLAGRSAGTWSAFHSFVEPPCQLHESCTPLVAEPIELGLAGGRTSDVFEVVLDESDPDSLSLVIVVWRTPDSTYSFEPGVPFEDLLASLEIGS